MFNIFLVVVVVMVMLQQLSFVILLAAVALIILLMTHLLTLRATEINATEHIISSDKEIESLNVDIYLWSFRLIHNMHTYDSHINFMTCDFDPFPSPTHIFAKGFASK